MSWNYFYWGDSLVGLVAAVFWIWMLVDVIKRGEWLWIIYMIIFPLSAIAYYFLYYRGGGPSMQGFELPGASRRHRIRELETLIHNLDNAHHYFELGDIYFQKGDLAKAEANYRASIQRDPKDIDARAHLGQCLLRRNRAEEAQPILYQVCVEDPKHDYGHSLMAYAETLIALKQTDSAIMVWKQVLQDHSYARAKVQLAELYLEKGDKEAANTIFREVIYEDRHTPTFQRRRERVWVRQAKRLLT